MSLIVVVILWASALLIAYAVVWAVDRMKPRPRLYISELRDPKPARRPGRHPPGTAVEIHKPGHDGHFQPSSASQWNSRRQRYAEHLERIRESGGRLGPDKLN